MENDPHLARPSADNRWWEDPTPIHDEASGVTNLIKVLTEFGDILDCKSARRFVKPSEQVFVPIHANQIPKKTFQQTNTEPPSASATLTTRHFAGARIQLRPKSSRIKSLYLLPGAMSVELCHNIICDKRHTLPAHNTAYVFASVGELRNALALVEHDWQMVLDAQS